MLIGEYLGGVDIKVEEIKKEKESEIEPLDKFIPIDMKENDASYAISTYWLSSIFKSNFFISLTNVTVFASIQLITPSSKLEI